LLQLPRDRRPLQHVLHNKHYGEESIHSADKSNRKAISDSQRLSLELFHQPLTAKRPQRYDPKNKLWRSQPETIKTIASINEHSHDLMQPQLPTAERPLPDYLQNKHRQMASSHSTDNSINLIDGRSTHLIYHCNISTSFHQHRDHFQMTLSASTVEGRSSILCLLRRQSITSDRLTRRRVSISAPALKSTETAST
jgi:hypothetical protein